MRAGLLIAGLFVLAACRDEAVALPSGLEATLHATITETDPEGVPQLVVQVLAPGLAALAPDPERNLADTEAACQTWGLGAVATAEPAPRRIIVQIMSEAVERGQPAPGVAQIFEGYRPENGVCIWEIF